MFHSHVHHDAEGYATFIQVTSGFKFWVILRPKKDTTQSTRSKLYEDQALFAQTAGKPHQFDKKWDRFLITAGPGDIV